MAAEAEGRTVSLDIKKEWLADALAGGHEPDFYTPASKEKTMTVRAKFKVESVTQTTSGASIKLQPVSSGSAENEKFFKWTPWGAP